MEKMNELDCQKLFDKTCRQNVDNFYLGIKDLIDAAADGTLEMQIAIKVGLARKLLENTGFCVTQGKSEPVVIAMAPAVFPNGTKIDLWQAIVDGCKVIDVRAQTEKYDSLDVDDVVCFQRLSDGAQILRRIGLVFRADDLEQLVKRIVATGLFYGDHTTREQRVISHIIPGLETLDALIQAINSFPDYAEKIKQYGVIAFVLMPLTAEKFETGKDAEMKRLGWVKEITGTGAEVFVRDD